MSRVERAILALEEGGRILVTRLQYLGDVVLTLPVVDALRERFPTAEIDYLSKGPGADLLQGDERLSRVFKLPEPARVPGLVCRLRRRSYDVAVDLLSNPRSAWLTRMSGARVRIGGSRRGRRWLYTDPMSVPREIRSAAAFHTWHLRALGIDGAPNVPALNIGPARLRRARELLARQGVPDGAHTLGVHPGGKWDVKRWSSASFAGLIGALTKTREVWVVVLTGPDEREHTECLRGEVGDGVVFLPALPVEDVAAVISELDGMVACDGGIMHVAAAVGTPTVGIFGSSEPDIWFPYGESGPHRAAFVDVPCRPCHQHLCPLQHTDCLNKLSVDNVLQALYEVVPQLVRAV